jgi:RimJ/RimL family protein N-acetyltransferase
MRLEPFSRAHVPLLGALLGDPDTLRWTRIPEPPPPGFGEDWAARYEAGRSEGTKEGFAALDASGEFLGLALVPSIDRESREAELGYMVVPSARGRGVATAILRELTAWALREGVQRCELIISAGNVASERVAERAGYVREGYLRSIHLKQGKRDDVTVWSRLPSDPDP